MKYSEKEEELDDNLMQSGISGLHWKTGHMFLAVAVPYRLVGAGSLAVPSGRIPSEKQVNTEYTV